MALFAPEYCRVSSSVWVSYFAVLGVDLIPEDATSQGRIDLTVRYRVQFVT